MHPEKVNMENPSGLPIVKAPGKKTAAAPAQTEDAVHNGVEPVLQGRPRTFA